MSPEERRIAELGGQVRDAQSRHAAASTLTLYRRLPDRGGATSSV